MDARKPEAVWPRSDGMLAKYSFAGFSGFEMADQTVRPDCLLPQGVASKGATLAVFRVT
jgi:hypothetical protein